MGKPVNLEAIDKDEYVKVISSTKPWEEEITSRKEFYSKAKVAEVVEGFVEVINFLEKQNSSI